MLTVANKLKLLLIAAVLLLPPTASLADNGTYATMQNEYMRIQMGQWDHAHIIWLTPDTQPRAGRWGMFTVIGDPENPLDDNKLITPVTDDGGPGWFFGTTTLNIDGNAVILGDQSKGGWNLPPFSSSSNLDNYDQRGRNGFYIYSEYDTNNIRAKMKMSIVRDQIRLLVTLVNNDTTAHNVGLRHSACLQINAAGISYPFTVTPNHAVIASVPGRGLIQHAFTLTGTDIPTYFEIYDDMKNPTIGFRNTLDLEDCTRPDRVAVGELAQTDWDYLPIPDRDMDNGWAAWWNPVLLNPGESKTIITYFGMSAASSSWTSSTGGAGERNQEDPFSVAVQGPKSLSIKYDPTIAPENMLALNPFQIRAYVYNLDRVAPLTNVSAYLMLPEGLELVDTAATQPISSVAPEKEGTPVVWTVKANGKASGNLEYQVSVSGTPGLQKTVKRSIMIPATSNTSFIAGWQLVSIPFKFSDPRIEQALGFEPDTYKAVRWDPTANTNGDYVPVTTLEPGKGFWLYSNVDRSTTSLAADSRPFDAKDPQRIILSKDWNQFGNPFIYNIPWGRVQVWSSAQVGPLSIDEAVARNLIRRTVYWYDSNIKDYVYSSDSMTPLKPWQGYWIKALQPCQLIIPAVDDLGTGVTGQVTKSRVAGAGPTAAAANDGWKLKLVAKAGTAVDSKSVIGISSRAADGYDSSDIEIPPALANYVAITFPHKDWGVNSGNYMTDIRRSASSTTNWEFDVASDKQNTDVVLTWPTLMDVPKNCRLKLVDVDGGVTKYLRTTSSYRYNTGNGGPRRFKIVAESNVTGRPVISGLAVIPSRAPSGIASSTISYNLSTDATADVVIRNTGGRSVRSIAQSRGISRGISNLSWNYRDDSGKPVPAGSYLIEVVATTPDGEVAKAIRPFLVAR